MSSYRTIKLALNLFRNRSSEIVQSGSRFYKNYNFANTAGQFSSISKSLGFALGKNKNHCNPIFSTAKRYYYVDTNNIQHFRARGYRRLLENENNELKIVLVGCGVCVALYFWNLETIPYTKRTHFVLHSKGFEKWIGESVFKKDKLKFKVMGKLLPPTHRDTIRIRSISKNVIEAMHRGLDLKDERVFSEYASVDAAAYEGRPHVAPQKNPMGYQRKFEGNWSEENEILDDDKWIQQSTKKGQVKGSQASTSHLKGLNWEVLVVDSPDFNAFCLPGGKIVVYKGLLKSLKSDAEIATVIGHEVGHIVARHGAEGCSWNLVLQLILDQLHITESDIGDRLATYVSRYPFSRRNEMEADYIGLLLVASAGYDPRVAVKVYQSFGDDTRDYLSTHPSGKKRAQALAKAQVMEEALTIFRKVRTGQQVGGFL